MKFKLYERQKVSNIKNNKPANIKTDQSEPVEAVPSLKGLIYVCTEENCLEIIACKFQYNSAWDSWEPVHETIRYGTDSEEKYREHKREYMRLPFSKRYKDYNDIYDLEFYLWNPENKQQDFTFKTRARDFDTESFSYMAYLEDSGHEFCLTVANENIDSLGDYTIDLENFVDDFSYIVNEFWLDPYFHKKMPTTKK